MVKGTFRQKYIHNSRKKVMKWPRLFGGLGQISLEDCGRFLWRIVADFFGVCDVRE